MPGCCCLQHVSPHLVSLQRELWLQRRCLGPAQLQVQKAPQNSQHWAWIKSSAQKQEDFSFHAVLSRLMHKSQKGKEQQPWLPKGSPAPLTSSSPRSHGLFHVTACTAHLQKQAEALKENLCFRRLCRATSFLLRQAATHHEQRP